MHQILRWQNQSTRPAINRRGLSWWSFLRNQSRWTAPACDCWARSRVSRRRNWQEPC